MNNFLCKIDVIIGLIWNLVDLDIRFGFYLLDIRLFAGIKCLLVRSQLLNIFEIVLVLWLRKNNLMIIFTRIIVIYKFRIFFVWMMWLIVLVQIVIILLSGVLLVGLNLALWVQWQTILLTHSGRIACAIILI